MFYAHFVLSKKGPLSRIWLAAHWDKKLTKAHVFETNISSSVEAILEPKVKMALRTSGHLLLGVVKIYSRKAKYLLADCNEAFVKIKMAFRPGAVDLPEKSREAAKAAITLPDNLQDFETDDLSHLTDELDVSAYQSRPEDITLKEIDGGDDVSSINLGRHDDDFGDETGVELMREASTSNMYHLPGADDMGSISLEQRPSHSFRDTTLVDLDTAADDLLPHPGGDSDNDDDGFGGDFDTSALFDDPMAKDQLMNITSEIENQFHTTQVPNVAGASIITEQESTRYPLPSIASSHIDVPTAPPSETSVRRRGKRRRLIIDEQKSIPSELMKAHMQDTAGIVTHLDLAPPTKKLMQWKETGSVDRLLAHTARLHLSSTLLKLFTRNAHTSSHAELIENMNTDAEEPVDMQLDIQDFHMQESVLPPMTPIREESSLIANDPILSTHEQPLIPTEPLSMSQLGAETPFPFAHADDQPPFLSHDQLDRELGDVEDSEEARTERRGTALLRILKTRLVEPGDACGFREIAIPGCPRKQAAAKFYTLLALCKTRAVELNQPGGPFTDIYVQRGPGFAQQSA